MVSLYQHNIYLSQQELKLATMKFQQINNTTYYCSSVTELFQQLSNCCNSTDISIEPGNYNLTLSYELADLHDIRIRSKANAVIQCAPNVDGEETGVAFVRVRNLVIANISIVGCGMKHVTTNHVGNRKFIKVHSALFIQNSTNISLDNITISESDGVGLLVYDTNGSVNITESSFINNRVNQKKGSGGGGVYIEFTECTPGLTQCNSSDNLLNSLTKYTIYRCIFQDNAAIIGSKPKKLRRRYFLTFGSGGGLSLWNFGHAQNNTFKIISTKFISNEALRYGGGVHIHSRQNTMYNNVEISQCDFLRNTCQEGGGGLTLGYVIYQKGGQSLFNTYIVANCMFKYNQALYGSGGGIVGFGSQEREEMKPTNSFEIHNSSFIGNEAKYGSAIEINKEFYASVTGGTVFTLVINDCNFTNNSLNESSSSIGAVAMSGVSVEFRGASMFSNNTSTALIVDGAYVAFSNNSMTTFQDNSGLHGGAISLTSGAWIEAYPNSRIVFLRNTAIKYGGAIYVALSTSFDYLLSHICFIRYYMEIDHEEPHEWDTNFTFINNTSEETSNTIFASTLRPCSKVYGKTLEELEDLLYNHPFNFISPMTNSVISTLPASFNFSTKNISVVPGEIYDLPVQLLDELNQSVSFITFIATCYGSPYVLPAYHFTNKSIQIAGKPGEVCKLHLGTDADYQIYDTAKVILLHCPPGFVYNKSKQQCNCLVNHIHQNSAISGCELASFQAYFNQFYWFGYESDDAVDLLISPCPYRYCYEDHTTQGQLLPRVANKTTMDIFVCGNRKRTGILCGQCIEGYSVALNSPTFTCYRCTNPYLGIMYLFIYYIIPVSALFYIIMAFNIRMTTGPIGAFLFFAQIVGSYYHFIFDYSVKGNSDEIHDSSNAVTTIYSISNLQFFQHEVFSYCLFSNAGTVDIIAFDLLLSFYPVLLVLIYFLLRRYFTCKLPCIQRLRTSNKSVIHGMCAFLVLCFAKINALAFGILKSADISHINGMNFKKVVYFQGSLRYFGEPLYVVYAIGSIFAIVTVIFIPTLILLFHPIMIAVCRYFKWGDTKCVTFINKLLFIHKLKPVLDSFQGDYKDNFSFFAGLHSFLYRIIFFSIVITTSGSDFILSMIAFFIIILLIHTLTMPFQRYVDNASYSLIYTLMLTIIIIKYYLFSTGKSSPGLIWFEIILSLLPFASVMLYCLWKLLIAANVIRRTRCRIDNRSDLVSK